MGFTCAGDPRCHLEANGGKMTSGPIYRDPPFSQHQQTGLRIYRRSRARQVLVFRIVDADGDTNEPQRCQQKGEWNRDARPTENATMPALRLSRARGLSRSGFHGRSDVCPTFTLLAAGHWRTYRRSTHRHRPILSAQHIRAESIWLWHAATKHKFIA
jgi:hypothetical protein